MSSGIIMRNGIQYGNAVLNKADEILTDDNKTVQDELNTLKTSLNDLNSKLGNVIGKISLAGVDATTNQDGFILVPQLNTSRGIISVQCSGYGAIPYVRSNGTYGIKVIRVTDLTPVANTETPLTIYFVRNEYLN